MQLWYPNAQRRMLGVQTEPVIGVPRILIFHTMVGHLAGSDAMFRQDGYQGTESHFGVGGPWEPGDLDGVVWQWQSIDRQADAQHAGNAYATSIETADGGDPKRPWTDRQLAALVDLAVWWCRQTRGPARLVKGVGEQGFGYRAQFPAWAPDGRSCPGPVRIRQLRDVVIPRVRAALAGDVPAPVTLHRVLRKRLPMMTGSDVRAVQRAAGLAGGDVDGRYWSGTEDAVKRFQRAHRLDVDGRVGPLTAAAMGLGVGSVVTGLAASVPPATVHHLAGHRPPAVGEHQMASVDDKLDRALELLADVRVGMGQHGERLQALVSQSQAQAREVEALTRLHRADIERIEAEITVLRARPVGLTGNQLWAGAAALIGTATALATLVGMLSRVTFN